MWRKSAQVATGPGGPLNKGYTAAIFVELEGPRDGGDPGIKFVVVVVIEKRTSLFLGDVWDFFYIGSRRAAVIAPGFKRRQRPPPGWLQSLIIDVLFFQIQASFLWLWMWAF